MLNKEKIIKFFKYTIIALILATALHFFNGYVMVKVIPANLIYTFIYDVFSTMIFIILGIILTHLGTINSYDYKHVIRGAFFISIITMIIVSAITFTGLGYFISTGIRLHIFGILFVVIPIIIGEYGAD